MKYLKIIFGSQYQLLSSKWKWWVAAGLSLSLEGARMARQYHTHLRKKSRASHSRPTTDRPQTTPPQNLLKLFLYKLFLIKKILILRENDENIWGRREKHFLNKQKGKILIKIIHCFYFFSGHLIVMLIITQRTGYWERELSSQGKFNKSNSSIVILIDTKAMCPCRYTIMRCIYGRKNYIPFLQECRSEERTHSMTYIKN